MCAALFVVVVTASTAGAQTWTSTDIGDVGAAGSASLNGAIWTVRGSGSNIWGTADAFQFVHTPTPLAASVVARVDAFNAGNAFAKAGVMVREGVAANAATAILDVRPNGAIEYMARPLAGSPMSFISTVTVTFPVLLRLSWSGGTIAAWVSEDGDSWTFLGNGSVALGNSPQAGLAVTSAVRGQLATAQFGDLAIVSATAPGWSSKDVGAVGVPGSATQVKDTWTIQGAGGNIWGSQDAFHFVYRAVSPPASLVARINDLQNTSPFAKAGIMLRANLNANSAAVILDVRPTGEVEFMERMTTGGTMHYVAGASVTLPAWLRLDMDSNGQVTARVSQDRTLWTPLPQTASMGISSQIVAGAAVTSQNTSRLNTAHVSGLSLLNLGLNSVDIGAAGLIGNAFSDTIQVSDPLTVQGAGDNIWGTADSFQFVDAGPFASPGSFFSRIVAIQGSRPFAKGGLMLRDGFAPNAAHVILDVRPTGDVEFMARPCPGCQTMFIAGTKVTLPAFFSLLWSGSTVSAHVTSGDMSQRIDLGSVTITIAEPRIGYAVTSQDTSQLATVVFDNPPQ
jgi:hypothetical protein